MNHFPLISIVIPVYNMETYLEECLRSVCSDPQPDMEIILVDDGSTDRSGDIARKWAAGDVRIRYIRQENQGVSAARNHGMELARGKWVMFVDADDTIEPDTMTKLRTLEPQFADAEIVCFDCCMDPAEDAVERYTLDHAAAEEAALMACGIRCTEERLPEANYACMWLKLYRSDFLHRTELKIDRELVRGEDLMFNCYAFSKASRAAFSPYCYYHYRDNPQSATRRRNPAVKERDMAFQKKLQEFVETHTYQRLEQIGVPYSALNGIAISFFAYFGFFRLSEYPVYRRELEEFLQQDCYRKYLRENQLGIQYLNRNARTLIFLLGHRMYFAAWLLFGFGRRLKHSAKQLLRR